MKVILTQDVRGQGKRGQMIEVSDGYARNFLLPRKLAQEATADNINTMRMNDKATQERQAKERAEALELRNRMKDMTVVVTAKGGGDIPEDGLEALAYAIRSDWTREGVKKRHIIVMWSDAPTHDLGHGKIAPWYPEGMAKDFDELSLWWEDEQLGGSMDENAKRLLIFAPDAPSWNRISSEWGQVIHVQTVSEGLLDVEYRQVLDAVCNTI